MKKSTSIYPILSILISAGIFFISYTKLSNPKTLYHVYLSGKTIGYIDSKKELEDYIDKKEMVGEPSEH